NALTVHANQSHDKTMQNSPTNTARRTLGQTRIVAKRIAGPAPMAAAPPRSLGCTLSPTCLPTQPTPVANWGTTVIDPNTRGPHLTWAIAASPEIPIERIQAAIAIST